MSIKIWEICSDLHWSIIDTYVMKKHSSHSVIAVGVLNFIFFCFGCPSRSWSLIYWYNCWHVDCSGLTCGWLNLVKCQADTLQSEVWSVLLQLSCSLQCLVMYWRSSVLVPSGSNTGTLYGRNNLVCSYLFVAITFVGDVHMSVVQQSPLCLLMEVTILIHVVEQLSCHRSCWPRMLTLVPHQNT